jgi:ABC-2 type transport system ATP-binding protein
VHESKAKEMLETVGLQKEAYSRPIKGLSAGMLQKFAIAHALIHEPEFVIADEPTSNLDPQARNEVLNLISKLHHDKKTTFLISSHILPELSKICESVAIINRGKVWAQGSFAELCEKFSIGATRISTDEPQKLAEVMKGLRYIRNMMVDSRGISVDVPEEKKQQLYGDIVKLAKKVKVQISGIESETTSLEELYNRAVPQRRND